MLIGITYKKKALAGVIHVPFSKARTTMWAVVGGGYGGIKVQTERDESRRIVATSKSHMNAALKELVDGVKPTSVGSFVCVCVCLGVCVLTQ